MLAAVEAGVAEPTASATGGPQAGRHEPLPNPAEMPVPNPPFPKDLTRTERTNLTVFDELDFVVFSNAEWNRMSESHTRTVRVHYPDGHFTDGLGQHITDLKALFSWAPDTHINSHPIRIAKGNLTCVTGVMTGSFTRPMPDGKGGVIKPTGRRYAVNMATVGVWNRRHTMDEEFLFWDNLAFNSQIGVA